jgi:hypothetical protein
LPPTGAGPVKTDDTVVVVVMTVVVAIATCRGSATVAALRRGPLVVAAALPVARGALHEHRLVGTDASVLSALVGAREGTVGATLRTQKQEELGSSPSKSEHLER